MGDHRAALRLPFFVVGDITADGDARLVSRLKAGDVAALGEAYDAHHAHVRAFARRLVGDDSAAEDLVQDAFVALPGAIARFRGESSLRTFIVSVAVNHARHHVRSAVRRRAAMQRFAEDPGEHVAGPESGASDRELGAALAEALDELPLEQRLAIVLCEVEERTAGEVARIVDAPEATVRTRVFHAKRKLREALAKGRLR